MRCRLFVIGLVALSVSTASASEPACTTPEAIENGEAGKWFWGIGASNYHCKLEESESIVDREVNGLLGPLMPGWKRPDTFQDWGDNWKVWALLLFVGKDFSPRWSGSVGLGGTTGDIRNRETYYPLFLPHQVRVDFFRYDVCLTLSAFYYPFKRPVYDQSQRSRLAAMFLGTRPFVSVSGNYVHFYGEADVRVGNPLIPKLLHQKKEFNYDLFSVCPAVGVEMPLSTKDSVSVTAGYSFFNEHGDEFDTPTLRLMYTRRFGGDKNTEKE